jgi:DnaJ-domain-containing protein 1
MPSFSRRNDLIKCRLQLCDGVEELRRQTHATLLFALDHLLPERMDTFFAMEERLDMLAAGCAKILDELEGVQDLAGLGRLEARICYLEARFDELDGAIRRRPRRRRKGWSLADFFRHAQGSRPWSGNGSDGIADSAEACGILGVAPGASFKQITRAFRRQVKALHPDARGGDRSAEPQLRRLLAAYDFLKQTAE